MKRSGGILHQQQLKRRQQVYRDLIRREAAIGGQLFGPVEKGRHREFFCLDRHTWVWHEEWYDHEGQLQSKTTRYEIQPNRILKVQDGEYYTLDKVEAFRFLDAIKLYLKRIHEQLYHGIA